MLYETTGAGKTYIACALAKSLHQSHNTHTRIIAPAHLISTWKHVIQLFQLDITCYSYHAASLNHIPYADKPNTLWILDEAHMLKNPNTKRYLNIKRLTARHLTCMLTATPISMGWRDLHALMIICGYPKIQEVDHPEWIYAFAATRIPQTYVPALSLNLNLNIKYESILYQICKNTKQLKILLDTLQKIDWYTVQTNSKITYIPLISSILMHRLCSHPVACIKTLQKLLRYYEYHAKHANSILNRKDFYTLLGIDGRQNILPFESENHPIKNIPIDSQKLQITYQYIQSALTQLQSINENPDDKYIQLINYINTRPQNEKLIIFSQYADTARYFAKKLSAEYRTALMTANESTLNGIQIDPQIIVAMFDPNQTIPRWWQENHFQSAKILVCSDAFACGHNFQNASVIIHLDTPWNPTTFKQRNGRIHRKGQSSNTIHIVSMNIHNAPKNITQYTKNLANRLHQREKIQKQWFHQINKQLISDQYLFYNFNNEPHFWIVNQSTWIPIAAHYIPTYIQSILNLEILSHKSSQISNEPQSINHRNPIIITNHNTELLCVKAQYTNLNSVFYPTIFKLNKQFEQYWKWIKKYQYIDNINMYIQSILTFIYQCALFPQLNHDIPDLNTQSKNRQSIFKQILQLPLKSLPNPQTQCIHINVIKLT